MLHRLALAGSVLAGSLWAAPAFASTMAAADVTPGQTLGLGFAGASYDYSVRNFAAGLAIDSANGPFGGYSSYNHLVAAGRVMGRFIDAGDFKASVLGGLELDPGYVGQRSYLIPDVGLAVAYHTMFLSMPVALRLALTVTVDQGQSGPQPLSVGEVYDPTQTLFASSRANWLQRLTFGPNTNLGLGVAMGDHLELTLGGGTALGARYHF